MDERVERLLNKAEAAADRNELDQAETYRVLAGHAAYLRRKEARERLTEYCKGDVAAERFLYDWARPGIANHPHLFVDGEASTLTCNRCGSSDTIDTARRYMASVMSYQMFRCANCTGYRRLSWEPERMSVARGV